MRLTIHKIILHSYNVWWQTLYKVYIILSWQIIIKYIAYIILYKNVVKLN